MPKPPSRVVSSAVWWVLSLAVIVLCGIGLTEAGFSPPPGSTAAVLLWLSLAAIVVGLLLEAWRDLFETAKYTAWIGASMAAFTGFIAVKDSTPLSLWLTGIGAVTWALSIAYRGWNQRVSSPWPDVLLKYTDVGAIHEVGDVQFTSVAAAPVTGGLGADVEMIVQNTVDAPRTVHLALEPEAKVSVANRAILVPDDVKVELAAGEVAKVILHCVAVGLAKGPHVYRWRVVTLGSGGRRIRRRRAPSLSVPLLTELISLFSALSIGARGRQVTFVATPSPSDVLHTRPTFRVEPLWRP